MNKFIKQQLDLAGIEYKESDNSIFIPKVTGIKLEEDGCYIIKLKETLFHLDPTSALITNWNAGSIPTEKYYKIDVSKILGNMVKITGISYNPTTKNCSDIYWAGWLPINEIEIMERL